MSLVRGNGSAIGANLAFTRFIFLVVRHDSDAALARLRAAGGVVARGFFNDFDADGTREAQPQETIQFLIRDGAGDGRGITGARYAVHVSANYRPRLQEVESELRRRIGDAAEMITLEGALRAPRYTSAEMHQYAYKPAKPRESGRTAPHAILVALNKTAAWWEKTALERHAFFYPHIDHASGCPVKGHAQAAEAAVSTVFRRLYHNPDGYQREGQFDFLGYFECAPDHLSVFERVRAALRDTRQNPEWQYVVEGPEWRGRRVLRW
jgi:hypothetical protein